MRNLQQSQRAGESSVGCKSATFTLSPQRRHGFPDDSGEPIEVTAGDELKLRRELEELAREKVKTEIDEYFKKPQDGSEL